MHIFGFLLGINKENMTEKQVHDYVIKMKSKFHPEIQEIIDMVPEEMKRSDEIFESPTDKAAKPLDNFIQGILEQLDNFENTGDVTFVPVTQRFLKEFPKMLNSPSSNEIDKLMNHLRIIIGKNEAKFNRLFVQVVTSLMSSHRETLSLFQQMRARN